MDMGNGTLGELSESKAKELEQKGVHIFKQDDEVLLCSKDMTQQTTFRIRNIGRHNIVLEPIKS